MLLLIKKKACTGRTRGGNVLRNEDNNSFSFFFLFEIISLMPMRPSWGEKKEAKQPEIRKGHHRTPTLDHLPRFFITVKEPSKNTYAPVKK
jgi:hypothetical protein